MISNANSAAAQVEVEPIDLETPKQSFRTSAFRNVRKPMEESIPNTNKEDLFTINRSEKIFTGALMDHKVPSCQENLELRLAQIMKRPAIQAVMQAARSLAEESQCSERDAAEAILESMKELHEIWEQILAREGLKRLSNL